MLRRNSSRLWDSGPTPSIHIDRSSCRYREPSFGAEFLHHFGLILDCSISRLMEETTRRYTQGGWGTRQIQSITVNKHNTLPEVQSLRREFPKITRPRTEQLLVFNTKVTHVIDTGESASTYAKVRQQSDVNYKSAKQEFTTLLRAGISDRLSPPSLHQYI